MPELPEVESVRRQLQPELSQRRVVKVWTDAQRRFHHPELLEGHTVLEVGRRGKFLVCPLDNGRELVLHLGMTGVLHFGPADAYTRARIGLDNGRELIFRDVRRFGCLAVVTAGVYDALPTLARLGPEPLSDAFDPERFARDLAATRSPVKPYLLSQRPVAGVGNIYADEALWLARVHPASRRVGRRRALALHGAIRQVLEEAIAREGTTFRDYRMVNGENGRNATFLIAYGQAGRPCPRCGEPLRRIVLSGRGTTFCRACQRR
ncbi:MAG TPA: bifunctional DNA-formamidopyrimidine glycosylase/DNA-(apurinic or apyrimidinic site) lyase [Actinomycetes bacterium]|jgi:formamidopyrimidine-DNA glycosylase|nr:bifunctional DNA-formamidopyrimidine glycosylase/DNA-(apurinic or apyrimidinic site) lyase [Actinomycetes bacterium]